MARHCSECMFCTTSYNAEVGKWQASCDRGYTLTNPKLREAPQCYFAEDARQLVPTVNPLGDEYLRSSSVCEEYRVHDEGKSLHFLRRHS